jgi:integrase
MSSSPGDYEEDDPTPIEDLPRKVRDPSTQVVTREEADRLLAALERRPRRSLARFVLFFRTFLRRVYRR